jgi:hypothetical protein
MLSGCHKTTAFSSPLNQFQDICRKAIKASLGRLHKPFKDLLDEISLLMLLLPQRVNFTQLSKYGKRSENTSGIEAITETAPLFTLLPTPASQSVTVKVSVDTQSGASLQIVNMKGQIVDEGKVEGKKDDLDVSHLPAGIYIVRLQTKQGITSQKLTISR